MGSTDGLIVFQSMLVAARRGGARMSTATITPELIAQHQLTPGEYQKIVDILGREPSYTELGIFSVMWSEHCSYKSSRLHLKKLPTRGKLVVQGPGENAGIIDIGGGYVIAFKIESHNHPSFIEPFQGAATGVGGILRDIFTMGARPIAVLDSLRFGRLDDPPTGARNRRILSGVVAGIAHYGNCFGVPTVGGECIFEPCYDGNPLVNVFALGVCRKEDVFYAKAAGVGNPVIYVGARTGRDGIHGASMASAEFTEESKQKRPNVQVGDPFMEKLLLEACLEAMQTGAIVGIQDMGAAGPHLLHLRDGQPRRSRHRNRARPRAAARNRHDALRDHALRIAGAHAAGGRQGPRGRSLRGLPQVGPGSRRDRRRSPAMASCACAITARSWPKFPTANWPTKRRSTTARTPRRPRRDASMPDLPPADVQAALPALLAAPDICSKRWIWEQYDYQVRTNTIAGPERDRRRHPAHQGDRHVDRDVARRQRPLLLSFAARRRASWRWPSAAAISPRWARCPVAATNCLNFGNPERPEIMAQLVEAIEGMAEACRFFDTPDHRRQRQPVQRNAGRRHLSHAGARHRGPDEDRRAGHHPVQERRPQR